MSQFIYLKREPKKNDYKHLIIPVIEVLWADGDASSQEAVAIPFHVELTGQISSNRGAN